MFHYIQSNQMEALSQRLANLLKSPTTASIFVQEQILVQSPGMSTWLRIETAKYNHIAAAQEYPLPSSFIWKLCYLLIENVPEENPYTKPAMTWKLMSLLPDIIDDSVYAPLQHYLGKDTELKLFQLCSRIADIFDQYLMYRPDWILAWENNESPIELTADQTWQPILWRALVDYNCNHLNQSHYHRANLHQALITCLKDNNHPLTGIPPRLFVFGLSSLAPQTLDVIYQLAARIDVYMLTLSPCQHYWGDIVDPKTRSRLSLNYKNKKQLAADWETKLEVGNPLLANNGKMGREMLDMILDLDPTHLQLHEEFCLPNLTSMLHGIQYDILEMETLGQSLSPSIDNYLNIHKRRVFADNDNSITIRSCHSPLREVEILHDHLLHLLKDNANLEPKDIVVMLPDVASYAPYIDAVFSSKQGNHYLPYAIADRGAAQESPLINSFLTLLSIDKSRFSLSEIISILEVPVVMAKFDINDDEMSLLRQWLNLAGVRWGRDANSREQQGLTYFDSNSWAFGIRRMLLGYALGDDADIYQGDLPLSGIEGQSAQALGKLLDFIEAIDNFKVSIQTQANAEQRIPCLHQLVDTFYVNNENSQYDILQIRKSIDQFANEINSAGFIQKIPLCVIYQWFSSKLTESRVGQKYLAGSVNFCTLMPMRSIPFNVICLLGMNDGVYPRIQYPVGFDLMAHNPPKRGDRSRRADDRYLFLEALLSAREQLYISYIGHSERDNSERIPSMLISELIEYCQLCYRPKSFDNAIAEMDITSADSIAKLGEQAAAALLSKIHITMPLQPFDEQLYSNDNHQIPLSFAANWCPVPKNDSAELTSTFINSDNKIIIENAITDNTELALSSLIRFYRNPAQYFFQRTLNVNLHIDIENQENDEPFALTSLDRHQIQAALIEDALKNKGIINDEIIAKLKSSGELPLAPFGNLIVNDYQDDIAAVIERSVFLRGNNVEKSIDINLLFSVKHPLSKTILLQGRIDNIFPKGLINVRPGTTKAKDIISLYIRHLCLCGSGHHQPSFLLDSGHFHALAPIDTKSAQHHLHQLISLFYDGQTYPLMFMPETSFAYQEDRIKNSHNHDEAIKIAANKWDNDSGFGEANDPYYNRLYQFPEDFTENVTDKSTKLTFAHNADVILSRLLTLYTSDSLSQLEQYILQKVY